MGEVDHPTVREEEHVLEEGEFIVEVWRQSGECTIQALPSRSQHITGTQIY